jgi:hypothetical protein
VAIHALFRCLLKDVDARHKAGHDGGRGVTRTRDVVTLAEARAG